MAADLIAMTMSAVGEKISTEGRSMAEVDAYASAVSDMLCAYLKSLGSGSRIFGEAERYASILK